jgi:tetratricopeptide (TPR) repeat protein
MIYDNMERWSKAEEYYIKSIDFMKIMPEEILVKYYCDLGISYKNLSMIYEAQNNFLKAEKFYLRAINAFNKQKGPNLETARFHLTDAYNAISLLYKKQGENVKAKKYVLKAVESCEILVTESPENYTGNLATTYMLCGKITNDRMYFAKARKIAKTFPNDPTCKLILDNID